MATTYPSIRLYYPGGKAGSFGTLAVGFKVGFEALGIRHALCDYRDTPDEEGLGRAGSGYDIGLYVGETSHLSAMTIHTSHKERLVMVAPNGIGIPGHVVKDCKTFGCTIIAPSPWAAHVMEPALGYRPEVLLHGVHLPRGGRSADDKMVRLMSAEMAAAGERPIRLLHVTSASTNRKGTRTLLRTLQHGTEYDFRLTIKTDKITARSLQPLLDELPAEVTAKVTVDTMSYANDGAMFDLYRDHDLVVQPSAAEGFGLVPLEAACAGVPSVLTQETGHTAFFRQIPCVEWYCSDEPGFIPGEDFDGYEPLLDSSALDVAAENLVLLTMNSARDMDAVASEWSWPAVIEKWLNERNRT